MKKLVFLAALTGLVLLGGCAKGGSGPCVVNCPGVTINPNIKFVGLNVPVAFTVTTQNPANQPVNWAIQPSSCGSACGTLTDVTTSSVTYNPPPSIPSQSFQLVATSQTYSTATESLSLQVIPDTTAVGPVSPNVGVGLTQQYAATAAPSAAPQTFTWTCTTPNGACSSFTQDSQISGLAYYTPTSAEEEACSGSGCVTISATANVNPTGCTIDPKSFPCTTSQTTVVNSRVPSGTYAFQFSGYDSNGKLIMVTGTFTVAGGGSISGTEDEITWNGSAYANAQHTISSGSYSPISGMNVNSNNAGTLTLNTGVFPSTYTAVLDGSGDVQMTASDGSGNNGSGFAEPSSISKFVKQGAATYAFGFTGADSASNRIGYAGLLETDGVSTVSGGLIDANDNGNASTGICTSAPCSLTGSLSYNSNTNQGQWTLITPQTTLHFDFFVANGSSSANNPLTLYAISTDTNPAVMGMMQLQDSKITTYNNAAFSGTFVSELMGANANVALVTGQSSGDSSESGISGACPGSNVGTVQGTLNQNNDGTLIPPAPLSLTAIGIAYPSTNQESANANPYTYVSMNGNTGRYIFCMLGNPTNSSPVLPIPFVLYASGANSGFLLDQSSSAVMTGRMYSQTTPKSGSFANAQAAGTYAVATSSNNITPASGCTDLVSCYTSMNLVFTSPTTGTFDFSGIENPGNTAIGGTYVVTIPGTGALTIPGNSSNTNFVIYGVTETNFYVIGWDVETTGQSPVYTGLIGPILYMAQ